jgi:Lantibiotic dehydratase, N terminus
VYVPIEWFLLRAPLLAEGELGDERALEKHPLGADAIALASEGVAGAAESEGRRRAMGRYARRAAFRTTPQGLLAGVCVGRLGGGLAVATGAPSARLTPAWGRMAALARALLDDESARDHVRLRQAPSLVRAPGHVRWIGPGDPFCETREAELDDRLRAVLDAATLWTPWPRMRAACGGDPGDADELLLVMIDQGLLQTDLLPPLSGPAAGSWMRARLEALERGDLAARLDVAQRELARGDLAAGRRALDGLPGGGLRVDGARLRRAESVAGGIGDPPRVPMSNVRAVHAVLVLEPRRPPTLPRAAVARAAAIAPLLFRLQEALAPPALERLAQPALLAALEPATEIFGAGALDLGALEAGAYGTEIDDADADADADGDGRIGTPLGMTRVLGAAQGARARATRRM